MRSGCRQSQQLFDNIIDDQLSSDDSSDVHKPCLYSDKELCKSATVPDFGDDSSKRAGRSTLIRLCEDLSKRQ